MDKIQKYPDVTRSISRLLYKGDLRHIREMFAGLDEPKEIETQCTIL